MSVVYSINETLKIKNEHNYKLIVGAIRFQYTLLGALMLNNDAKVFELNLKADGKDYSFSGEAVTPEFKELLDAMRSAIEIELNASYEYWWRGGYANMNIGPFPVCELIEDMLKEGDVEAKDFFYSMYNSADCEQGYGILSAFGEKDGKQYCGVIEAKVVEELPEDGEWYAADTLICCEVEDLSEVNADEVIAACRAFDSIGGDYTLDANENGIDFYLNDVKPLGCREDFEKYIDLDLGLYRTVYDGPGMGDNLQFIDESGTIPRLLELEINIDGSYTVKMASV